MKKVLFILLIVLSFNVYACDAVEKTRLSKLADLIDYDYDYKVIENKTYGDKFLVDYTLNMYNVSDELQVRYYESEYDYQKFVLKENKYTLPLYEGGKYRITVVAHTKNDCSGEVIAYKNIQLPYYNQFYKSEECENSEFKYCKSEMIEKYLSYEDIEKLYNDYVKEQSKKLNVKIENITNNNYFVIIIFFIVIILSSLLFVFLIRKHNDNKVERKINF